jgi:hypothetical protein
VSLTATLTATASSLAGQPVSQLVQSGIPRNDPDLPCGGRPGVAPPGPQGQRRLDRRRMWRSIG